MQSADADDDDGGAIRPVHGSAVSFSWDWSSHGTASR